MLERVTVDMEAADGFEMVKQIACPSLRYNKPGTTYTLARLPEDPTAGNVQTVIVNKGRDAGHMEMLVNKVE